MTNRWKTTSLTSDQERYAAELEGDFGPLVSRLLVERDVNTFEEARQFFRPDLGLLHDPFLMKDMDAAVERLNKALRKKEKILIYGDYDVDGTTAVALVYGFLSRFTPNNLIGYYIPDRYTEGYGISAQSIAFARDENYSLIIALDCGIKAVEKVALAKSYGIDFIICDHHTADAVLPAAVAVLDSKREDCTYPYESLSGCGVGYKLMQAFSSSNGIDPQEIEEFLDLAAVSIASDIVPITGENRILAYWGLQKLNKKPSLGLSSIINVCKLRGKEIDISDIVFKIGPRINASGRMRTGNEVVELLTTNDPQVAADKCSDIDSYNTERRDLDKRTTDDAKAYIENDALFSKKQSLVVFNAEWNKGIVGIVASRLAEEYHRPTVVLTQSTHNELISGSARSVIGFDLYSAIDSCRDLLENFGGHMYAAGLSLKRENLELFSARFETFVNEHILPEQLIPQIEIDAEVTLADLTPKFIRILKQFNPFGPNNMKPVFCVRNVFNHANNSRLVGKEQQHLKLDIVDVSGSVFQGIAFSSGNMRDYNMALFAEHLQADKPLDICFTIEENKFNGIVTPQLMIRDIKFPE